MFSTRLPASLVPTPLAAAVASRRRGSGRLVDLTLSNPTMAGLAYPETLATAFANVAALRYEPDPRGLRSARETITRRHICDESRPGLQTLRGQASDQASKVGRAGASNPHGQVPITARPRAARSWMSHVKITRAEP